MIKFENKITVGGYLYQNAKQFGNLVNFTLRGQFFCGKGKGYTKQDGTASDYDNEFISCIMFENQELVPQLLDKTPVEVTGVLQLEKYTSKTGDAVKKWKIKVNELTIKTDTPNQQQKPKAKPAEIPDEIPF